MRYVIRGGKKHLLGPAKPDPGIEKFPQPVPGPSRWKEEWGGISANWFYSGVIDGNPGAEPVPRS